MTIRKMTFRFFMFRNIPILHVSKWYFVFSCFKMIFLSSCFKMIFSFIVFQNDIFILHVSKWYFVSSCFKMVFRFYLSENWKHSFRRDVSSGAWCSAPLNVSSGQRKMAAETGDRRVHNTRHNWKLSAPPWQIHAQRLYNPRIALGSFSEFVLGELSVVILWKKERENGEMNNSLVRILIVWYNLADLNEK